MKYALILSWDMCNCLVGLFETTTDVRKGLKSIPYKNGYYEYDNKNWSSYHILKINCDLLANFIMSIYYIN